MPLTVVVGSSGSGKTTFLEHVHQSHNCTYIRQYHMMRPYITVTKIPNFDPSKLPFWETYVKEGKANSIKTGGTMGGVFTAGFSGGQRKLLLFELICQRMANQKDCLIVLDEPFAGVTDDFVPFITNRLEYLQKNHNVLMVTNDHVEALKAMSDNIITVSAVDRTTVKINDREKVPRDMAIMALSVGDQYVYKSSGEDFKFFVDVEIFNEALLQIAIFTTFCFGLFIATFWDSSPSSSALVLVAGSMIAYFSVNPYLLSLVDWRNGMVEEAEALVHASKTANRNMKLLLTLTIVVTISVIEFGVVNAAMNGHFNEFKYWVAMVFESASLTVPLAVLCLFTPLGFQEVSVLGSLPFLLMIFFSTTFSPGAGVPGLKALRYLFTRYYFWCLVPEIEPTMEGCPESNTLLYLILSSFVVVFIIFSFILYGEMQKWQQKSKDASKLEQMKADPIFQELQESMYGAKVLRRLSHQPTLSEHGMATEAERGNARDTLPDHGV